MALQLLISDIAVGFVYALTVVEYTLIWNSSRLLNLRHEKVITLGVYIFVEAIMLNLEAGMVPGVVATLILMALSDVVIAFTILTPLRHMSRLCAIMTTVMMENIINEAARLYYGPEAMTIKGFIFGTFHLGGLVVTKAYLYITLISVAIVAALELFMRKAKTGKTTRCVASNKTAAVPMGVNVQQNTVIIVAISFAVCGALGMSVIPVFSVNSSMAIMIFLEGPAAGVVGGFGSLSGAVIGGLTLGIVESIVDMVFPSTFKNVVAFVVPIIALLVKPSGLPEGKR